MSKIKTYVIGGASPLLLEKFSDYVMLTKFRLTLVVVISSVIGYLIVAGSGFQFYDLILLIAGGFLVTASANTLNQVLEKDFDINMSRTANRPLAAGRMKSSEAVMFAGLSCLVGISILALFNPVTALLGMLSLITYSFVYTPLKRFSTAAVAVGAIPGALPVMIGCTAFEGKITFLAFGLFVIQFLWQFPHFWSIGFLGFDDYKRAGFKLLPETNGEIDRNLGLFAAIYGLMILPVIYILYSNGLTSIFSSLIVLIFTLIYIALCIRLNSKFNRVSAMALMFYSFFYLPFVLLSYWLI